jgi:hypothetical protein
MRIFSTSLLFVALFLTWPVADCIVQAAEVAGCWWTPKYDSDDWNRNGDQPSANLYPPSPEKTYNAKLGVRPLLGYGTML